MIEVNPDILILATCIILPIFCLIVTLYFIFKKVSNLSKASDISSGNQNQHYFEDEIAIHVICQQLDDFLVKTSYEIEKYRDFLRQYLDGMNKADLKKITLIGAKKDFHNGELINKNNIFDHEAINDQNVNSKERNTSTVSEFEYDFNHISELVRSGLTSKQISESTKIPHSEVDLYIKLHLKKKKKNQTTKNPVSLFRLSV